MNFSPLRSRLAVASAFLFLFGAGCFGGTTTAPAGPDGGIWKTSDGGQTWVQKKATVIGPKVTAASATYSILAMTFDPQDRNTVYAVTRANGLIVSLDGGESWQQSNSTEPTKSILSSGRVNAIAVDPKNKCTVYATMANKIYKTETCGRDWAQIFFDPRTDKIFTQVAIDWFNPTILFAGTSDGDVFRSVDSGVSWQTSKRVDGVVITSLVIDRHDSRTLYVGTQGEGILKSTDSGTTWTQIKKEFGDEFQDARRVIQVVLDPIDSNTIYEVSKYGIIKSTDAGATWSAIPLTSPPGSIKISSLAVDAKNTKHLVYTGTSVLQFSNDGGATWIPKKLPTTQIGSTVMIDPMDSSVIYLGTAAPVTN